MQRYPGYSEPDQRNYGFSLCRGFGFLSCLAADRGQTDREEAEEGEEEEEEEEEEGPPLVVAPR
eukprot:3585975-Pyramimonas_sp.AAC.1